MIVLNHKAEKILGDRYALFADGRRLTEKGLKKAGMLELKKYVNNTSDLSPNDVQIGEEVYKIASKRVDFQDELYYYMVPLKRKHTYQEKADPLKMDIIIQVASYLSSHGIAHRLPLPTRNSLRAVYDIDIIDGDSTVGVIIPLSFNYLVSEIISKKRHLNRILVLTLNNEDHQAFKAGLYAKIGPKPNIFFLRLEDLWAPEGDLQALLGWIK